MKAKSRSVSVWFAALAILSLVLCGPLVRDGLAGRKIYRMKIQSLFPRGDLSMELLKVFAGFSQTTQQRPPGHQNFRRA